MNFFLIMFQKSFKFAIISFVNYDLVTFCEKDEKMRKKTLGKLVKTFRFDFFFLFSSEDKKVFANVK